MSDLMMRVRAAWTAMNECGGCGASMSEHFVCAKCGRHQKVIDSGTPCEYCGKAGSRYQTPYIVTSAKFSTNPFERDFLRSVFFRLEKRKELTPKMIPILERILARFESAGEEKPKDA